MTPTPRRREPTHENRLVILTFLAALPGSLTAFILIWAGDYTPKVRWTLTVVIVGLWAGYTMALRERAIRPLQTLSNLLGALREGDFSIRARGARRDDALGEVLVEVNALTETLREQRLGALEATAILRKVMEEIDVAVFAFDESQKLKLANRAAERLLGQPVERLMGRTAGEVGLAECLDGPPRRVLDVLFPGAAGRWEARRSSFRQGGLPHQLLVLSDLSRTLREEERQAWQRLIRVLGHEMNNSLAPIKSIAGSLESLLSREPRPPDWDEDMRRGLAVIGARSESLSRFMDAYARLARLPQPTFAPVDLGALLRRVASLETRVAVVVEDGPSLTIDADSDQLEQLFINLIRNAADAAMETKGGVRVGWRAGMGTGGRRAVAKETAGEPSAPPQDVHVPVPVEPRVSRRSAASVEVWVEDDGPGLPATTNLFVPFFTTKPGGSGIGLVLSRQIAEGHGGALVLANRGGGAPGCRATLRIPLRAGQGKVEGTAAG